MIVADTNAVIYLVIPGSHTEAARAAYEIDPEWVAPAALKVEVLNVLSTYRRKSLLTQDEAVTLFHRAVDVAREMPAGMEAAPQRVLELSKVSGCSGYDCIFVGAAKANSLPLVTFDKALLKAFPETAILPHQIGEWFAARNRERSE